VTDAERIQILEAELLQARQVIADQAAALAAHAEREQAERERKEARSRINRENYARRRAKMFADAVQASDSESESGLNQTLNPPPLDGSPLPPTPSLPSPLSSPPETTLSAGADLTPTAAASPRQAALLAEPEQPRGPKPEDLRALWNQLAPSKGLQRWEAMGDDRKRQAKAALAECPDLARWEAWLTHELQRPFNLGDNNSNWRANVDWLLRVKTRGAVRDFDPKVAAMKPPTGDKPRLGPVPSPTTATNSDKPRL